MIFRKQPLTLDAWIDASSDDESLLAFAVHEKIPLTLAIAHPHHSERISQTAATICKQFIQDRFLQFSSWMSKNPFSWSEALSKHLLEIKQWLIPKEETDYQAISQMIWLNWLVVVYPQTAFLISIGENHTHLFRRGEWQSLWEIPVDSSDSDYFLSSEKVNQLPSLCLRQFALHQGDIIMIGKDVESIRQTYSTNQKDTIMAQQNAKQTLDTIYQYFNQLHPLSKSKQSVGMVQVSREFTKRGEVS